jgi:hypothetical protein
MSFLYKYLRLKNQNSDEKSESVNFFAAEFKKLIDQLKELQEKQSNPGIYQSLFAIT